MKIYVTGPQDSFFAQVKGYQLLPGPTNPATVIPFVQQQLLQRQNHFLSAAEFKYNFQRPTTSQGHAAHDVAYVVADRTAQEFFIVPGLSKGKTCQEQLGALTMDLYLDMLQIPVTRRLLTFKDMPTWGGQAWVDMPCQKRPSFSLAYAPRVCNHACSSDDKALVTHRLKGMNEKLPLAGRLSYMSLV